jgi:hypothetical protein
MAERVGFEQHGLALETLDIFAEDCLTPLLTPPTLTKLLVGLNCF